MRMRAPTPSRLLRRPWKAQPQPGVRRPGDVAPELSRPVERRHDDVQAAVVVESVKGRTPAAAADALLAQTTRIGDVANGAPAGIPEQRKGLTGKRHDGNVGPAVVVAIAKAGPQVRNRLAVVAQGYAGKQAHLLKDAAAIAEQEVGEVLVGDEEVHPPVAVMVRDGDAHAFARVTGNACLLGDVLESPVAAVAVENVRQLPVVARVR
jgi:hypothetical protein